MSEKDSKGHCQMEGSDVCSSNPLSSALCCCKCDYQPEVFNLETDMSRYLLPSGSRNSNKAIEFNVKRSKPTIRPIERDTDKSQQAGDPSANRSLFPAGGCVKLLAFPIQEASDGQE